jgi:hypothetical protein
VTRIGAKEIALMRMSSQLLAGSLAETPAAVVSRLGAVQAQDFYGSLWAIGQRSATPTKTAVEAAIAERKIVRSWPLRGTLHFVVAEDLRWMVRLLAPRVLKQHAARIQRDMELDSKSMVLPRKVIVRTLEEGTELTRAALYRELESAGVHAGDSRGLHILWWLAHEGLICFGAHAGRQPTFALLDEWVPNSRELSGDEALAELALRYFTGHGPATAHDFGWWANLAITDARRGLEMVQSGLEPINFDNSTYWHSGVVTPATSSTKKRLYLLPAYDEFTVGYSDRGPIMIDLGPEVGRGTVIFKAVLMQGGQVLGLWKPSTDPAKFQLQVEMFPGARPPTKPELERATKRYLAFLNG